MPTTSCSDSRRDGKPDRPPCWRMVWKLLGAAGEDLVGVGLVPHVPDDLVARALQDAVQSDGELDDPQARCEVTARLADARDDELADLVTEQSELALREAVQIARRGDRRQDAHARGSIASGIAGPLVPAARRAAWDAVRGRGDARPPQFESGRPGARTRATAAVQTTGGCMNTQRTRGSRDLCGHGGDRDDRSARVLEGGSGVAEGHELEAHRMGGELLVAGGRHDHRRVRRIHGLGQQRRQQLLRALRARRGRRLLGGTDRQHHDGRTGGGDEGRSRPMCSASKRPDPTRSAATRWCSRTPTARTR